MTEVKVTQADISFAKMIGRHDRITAEKLLARYRTQSVEQALAPWVEAVEELRQYLQFEVNSFSRPNDIAWLAKIDALLATRKETDHVG